MAGRKTYREYQGGAMTCRQLFDSHSFHEPSQTPQDDRHPLGQWYCESPDCVVREVHVTAKLLDPGGPPTADPELSGLWQSDEFSPLADDHDDCARPGRRERAGTMKGPHPTEILIQRARELLEPSAVRQNHIPGWLTKRIKQRLGRIPGCHYADDRLRKVASMAAGRVVGDSWLDHWGSTTHRGRKAFVTEPYADRNHVEAALRFADMLGLRVEFAANSWWFPSQTLRIAFYLPDEERA